MEFFQKNTKAGLVETICGCMFSGKTEELIKLLKRAQFAKKSIKIFKPYLDNRYKIDFIVSHSNLKLPCYVVEDSKEIADHLENDTKTEVVAIDEVQFFDENIVTIIQDLANRGIHVICAGLDTNWQGLPFHPMPHIMSVSDIIKQYAVCSVCGSHATRTQRTVPSKENILVGSGEIYQARCRMHFSPTEVNVSPESNLSSDQKLEAEA